MSSRRCATEWAYRLTGLVLTGAIGPRQFRPIQLVLIILNSKVPNFFLPFLAYLKDCWALKALAHSSSLSFDMAMLADTSISNESIPWTLPRAEILSLLQKSPDNIGPVPVCRYKPSIARAQVTDRSSIYHNQPPNDFVTQAKKNWVDAYGAQDSIGWTSKNALFAIFFAINDVNNR